MGPSSPDASPYGHEAAGVGVGSASEQGSPAPGQMLEVGGGVTALQIMSGRRLWAGSAAPGREGRG